MVAIRLKALLTEDRRLILEVPDEVPSGALQVVIEFPKDALTPNPARERERAKLASAGALSTTWKAPSAFAVTDDEDESIELLPGTSTDEIIDQERDGR